ncbi:MAG: hypothetical protein ACTIA2_08285 [Brevibacterium aurantiacum]|uniref:hypothetical protein n=1 Tax=Brevibacterium aurantiacum TaxID=273384 RepID=UPI000DF31365|nr:hypothetical protein [Brevibacterium aurantiacum]RCS87919.1 hypothetical protein CIK63_12105 [Brevibacterium aurantiacum]RCS93477.1 hypothetical protein CIK61_15405 [Brevibacterium aurantiacum]
MTKMNAEARQRLDAAGISLAEWSRRHSASTAWHGDKCGCPDDRCIGYHHDPSEPCQCLPALIRDYETEKRSSAEAAVIWAEFQAAQDSADTDGLSRVHDQTANWVDRYQGQGVTSWSLTEQVNGRAGITITNCFNNQRWLVWAAERQY